MLYCTIKPQLNLKGTFRFILFLLLPVLGFGQEFSISGRIVDTKNIPVSYASVFVMTQQDSTVIKGVSSDDEGFFKLNSLKKNTYIFKVSFIGYKDFLKTITVESDLNLQQISLDEATENLEQVNIVVKKPTLKREADRLVFNIENSALIEGNILQVLKSTPGVLVIDDKITVKNTTPTVYINNRKVHLSSNELAQLLDGTSASAIKSVEVITNPSARYDAESGVVLNIVMSKNLVTGYRGNVFANYTQGVFPRYNVGMSHFFKSEKINFFANYSYKDSKINRDSKEVVNYLDDNLNIEQTWKSRLNRNTWSNTHSFNFNLDYSLDDKNTLSLSSNMLFLPSFEYKILNNTNVFDTNQNLEFYFDANNLSQDEKSNLGFDLDYLHEFTKGELSINTHYTTYTYERDQQVISDYFDSSNAFIETTAFNTDSNQDTKIFTAQLDYSLPINDTATFETGMKSSMINTDSDITQYDVVNDQQVLDINNSDAFDYDEDIFAAYVNYATEWDKWSLIAGLRAEQTDIKGVSRSNNQTNKQNYLEWFPTISISFQATDNFSLYTNYKRSIERPDYQSLNPFQFFLNDNTIVVGNPGLQPVFIDHAVIGTSLYDSFFIEAYYKVSDNNIFELPRQNNSGSSVDERFIAYTPTNLDKTIEFGFDFVTFFDVMENWSVYFVSSFYHTKDEGAFDSNYVEIEQWSNYSVLSNDFTFLKDRSLTANLTLTWVGKNVQGFRTVEDRLDSELSIAKSILKKKAVISLSAGDLFNMQDYDTTTRYLDQNSSNYSNIDSRFIKLGFRYKFGNTNLSTNQRSKGVKERDRLQDRSN